MIVYKTHPLDILHNSTFNSHAALRLFNGTRFKFVCLLGCEKFGVILSDEMGMKWAISYKINSPHTMIINLTVVMIVELVK